MEVPFRKHKSKAKKFNCNQHVTHLLMHRIFNQEATHPSEYELCELGSHFHSTLSSSTHIRIHLRTIFPFFFIFEAISVKVVGMVQVRLLNHHREEKKRRKEEKREEKRREGERLTTFVCVSEWEQVKTKQKAAPHHQSRPWGSVMSGLRVCLCVWVTARSKEETNNWIVVNG